MVRQAFFHNFGAIGEFTQELYSASANILSRLSDEREKHLFSATSNFVHHFIAISKFKLE